MAGVRFIYLTLPQNDSIVLNVNTGEEHVRYVIERDQLFQLNGQIVDILTKNRFDEDGAQLVLSLEKAATL